MYVRERSRERKLERERELEEMRERERERELERAREKEREKEQEILWVLRCHLLFSYRCPWKILERKEIADVAHDKNRGP